MFSIRFRFRRIESEILDTRLDVDLRELVIRRNRFGTNNMALIHRGMGLFHDHAFTMAHIAFLSGIFLAGSSFGGVDDFFRNASLSLIAYYYAIVLRLTCTIRSSVSAAIPIRSAKRPAAKKRAKKRRAA